MFDNKDEKSKVISRETSDRADKFIMAGIKKGTRRGKVILSQKLVAIILVGFLGGGFFSEILAQQMDFIPVIRDIYASFYTIRNLDSSKVETFSDNQIIENKVNESTMTIKNLAYDGSDIILFYEVKNKKEYFDIGRYRVTNEQDLGGISGSNRSNYKQLFKNEEGEFVVNGILNLNDFPKSIVNGEEKIVFAFDLWSKTEIDNMYDYDISNNREVEFKDKVSEYDVCFEFDKNELEKEESKVIEIGKSLKGEDLEFLISKIEIKPFSTTIYYKNNNIVNGFSIGSMNLSDGNNVYYSISSTYSSDKNSDNMFTYESMFFEDVKELYITSYTINQEKVLHEKLKIDFVNKTVNDEYNDFIDIIDVSYDEEAGVWNVDLKWKEDFNMWIQWIYPGEDAKYKCVGDKEDYRKMRYFVYADKDTKEYEFTIEESKQIGLFECNLKIK